MPSKPILLIETSTERAVVGIVQAGHILYQQPLPVGLNNSRHLGPAVDAGLKQLSLKMIDFDYVAVGIGPGSYTGIRMGVMLAKTLSFAVDIPLVGVCSLQCFTPPNDGTFMILIDAKISGVYTISGVKAGEIIKHTSQPQVLPLNQLEKQSVSNIIITPWSKQLKEKLPHFASREWVEVAPDLLQMASLAEESKRQGKITHEGSLELMYLRKTEAELLKNKENLHAKK